MHLISINWSDGARTRGLMVGPVEVSLTRECKAWGGYLYLRVLGPGSVNWKLTHRSAK